MKPPFAWFFVIGVGLMVAFPVLLVVAAPQGSPPPIPSCPYFPHASGLVSVPAGQTVLAGSGSGNGEWRLSIWSNSSSTYSLFLLTQDQYGSYAVNGSGANGSVHYGPPTSYYWTSGPVTSTNNTFLFGNGTWDLLVYNPGSSAATVNIESASCNAP